MSEYAGPVHSVKKARVSHYCNWCGRTIEKGMPYKRWLWFCDGRRDTVKAHPECFEYAEREPGEAWIWFDGDGHRPGTEEKENAN